MIRLLIMLNPRHASGAVWRMQRDRTANIVHLSAFRHPNVVTGENVIPGAVDRKTTVRRINEWTRPIRPGEKIDKDSIFVLPKCLEGATLKRQGGGMYPALVAGQYKIVNPAFSYMVLGQYPAQAVNQLISREWISAARARYDGRCCFQSPGRKRFLSPQTQQNPTSNCFSGQGDKPH